MSDHHEAAHGTLGSYSIGFVLSIVFTLVAYLFTRHNILPHQLSILLVVSLAIAQFAAQLLFFLHLSRESKPRWNLVAFSFMLMVVIIIVFGSLWIMYNLNYNHVQNHKMPPDNTDTYILKDEGIQR